MKQVLVVGESGSGKSTLINMVANFFMCGTLVNPPDSMHVLIPTACLRPSTELGDSERSTTDQTRSKTTHSKSYTWDDITFIDTPGFADTDGPDQDDRNVLDILDTVANAGHLSAIVIVSNGTNSRIVSNIRTAINRLRGNIPDVALQNIIYVMTNCAGAAESNFSISALPFKPCVVAYMNNSAFSEHPAKWNQRARMLNQLHWNASMEVIERLVQFISHMPTFSTDAFRTMHTCRLHISSELTNSIQHITSLKTTQDRILDSEASLSRHVADMNRNENFVTRQQTHRTVTDRVQERRECSNCDGRGSCMTTEERPQLVVQYVPAMTMYGFGLVPVQGYVNQTVQVRSSCRRCDGVGHMTVAVDRPRTINEVVDEINSDMKRRFQDASLNRDKCVESLKELAEIKNAVNEKMNMVAKSVNDSCNSIASICSNFDFKEECDALIQQLKALAALEREPNSKASISKLVSSLETVSSNATPSDLTTEAGLAKLSVSDVIIFE